MPIDVFRDITQRKAWCAVAESVIEQRNMLPGSTESFGTYWIEAGHHIRQQIDDDEMLCTFLRLTLPAYEGAAMTLYRGENIDRYRTGNVGPAWTSDIETARMFASGLNAINSGGTLLQAHFPAGSVITGPNAHSQYLGEAQFTVDVTQAQNVKVLQQYKSSHYG